MTASDRSQFLQRVAAAVRAGNRYRNEQPAEIPRDVGYLGAGPDPASRLVEELQAVGAHPRRARTRDEAQEAIRTLLGQYRITRAVRSAGALLDELAIDELLQAAGVEALGPRELEALDEPARRDRLFAAEIGITQPDWVVAETGTLVYVSGPGQTRSATLLPPVHLSVVDSQTVLSDLFDWSDQLDDSLRVLGLAGNVALVTGPSKTGDIELQLTTGVHGPGEVHVLVWDRTG